MKHYKSRFNQDRIDQSSRSITNICNSMILLWRSKIPLLILFVAFFLTMNSCTQEEILSTTESEVIKKDAMNSQSNNSSIPSSISLDDCFDPSQQPFAFLLTAAADCLSKYGLGYHTPCKSFDCKNR